MVYFLTSSFCLPDSPALNPANGFVDELRGEAYLIKNGVLTQIGREGGVLPL